MKERRNLLYIIILLVLLLQACSNKNSNIIKNEKVESNKIIDECKIFSSIDKNISLYPIKLLGNGFYSGFDIIYTYQNEKIEVTIIDAKNSVLFEPKINQSAVCTNDYDTFSIILYEENKDNTFEEKIYFIDKKTKKLVKAELLNRRIEYIDKQIEIGGEKYDVKEIIIKKIDLELLDKSVNIISKSLYHDLIGKIVINLYSNNIDKYGNYYNISIFNKSNQIQNIKQFSEAKVNISEYGFPEMRLEDINSDGNYELLLILYEKVNKNELKEKVIFIDLLTKKQVSLDELGIGNFITEKSLISNKEVTINSETYMVNKCVYVRDNAITLNNYEPSNMKVIDSINEKNCKLFSLYDPIPITESFYELKNNPIILLDINNEIKHKKSWVIYSEQENYEEKFLRILNNDLLVMTYPIGGIGTSNSSYEINVYKLNDRTEVDIERWKEYVNKIKYEISTKEAIGKISFFIENKTYVDEFNIYGDFKERNISFGGNTIYEIENDILYAYVSVAYNNTNIIGYIRIEYYYSDNRFIINGTSYS